ncbi:protein adenylyltransferase SelO [Paenisporosarcina cavernae]|uniref:Protein nucleotidyltransferase YdiU n=1 Tax=Paenisporosarcina cavernae TaxID=2320858 RepID=A0A385YWJ8_9BACL|nr:YdiU family protein [Paenisporosarcina cavernae]AYC30277.1 YdiU family protein [Paenisporosarcina cavernae]
MNKNITLDNSYITLPDIFYSKQLPARAPFPKTILVNNALAEELGINEALLSASFITGNDIPENAVPIAQSYAGHQFGHFTMLGDGRAILLGEWQTPQGKTVDLQLKGAGPTSYSRGGDGRAALGPMVREYLISEAMHGLGIPTTRSLGVATTGESVYRESKLEGAVLARVAASHLRVGTFQFARQFGTLDDVMKLADYAIARHYQEIADDENKYENFLAAVMERQAKLIAKWQLVGFIHGVMNTDNMTISGETIDYGPCAFMDTYARNTVYSSIDVQGRYAYGNQPPIAHWNVMRLAESLLPLIHEEEDRAIELAETILQKFPKIYHREWMEGMCAKLGLFEEKAGDEQLVGELLELMEIHAADYTNTFRAFALNTFEGIALFKTENFLQWKEKWEVRRANQEQSISQSNEFMKQHNPAIIPRNYLVENALAALVNEGNNELVLELLNVLKNPYTYSPEQEKYAAVPPSNDSFKTYCGT